MSREIIEKSAHVILNVGVLFLLVVFFRLSSDILANKIGDKWLTIMYFQSGMAVAIIVPALILLRSNKTIKTKTITILRLSEVYVPIIVLLLSLIIAGVFSGN